MCECLSDRRQTSKCFGALNREANFASDRIDFIFLFLSFLSSSFPEGEEHPTSGELSPTQTDFLWELCTEASRRVSSCLRISFDPFLSFGAWAAEELIRQTVGVDNVCTDSVVGPDSQVVWSVSAVRHMPKHKDRRGVNVDLDPHAAKSLSRHVRCKVTWGICSCNEKVHQYHRIPHQVEFSHRKYTQNIADEQAVGNVDQTRKERWCQAPRIPQH